MAVDHRADWGPTVEGRHRRRLGRWFLLLLAVLTAVVLAIPALISARLPRTPVDGLAADGSPMHVLVVGSDSREDLTPEERRELSTGSGAGGSRTDTIFVMTIDDGEAALLGIPRDLWVTRCDGSVGRINAAESVGGPGCLVATVRELSGLDIQHRVSVSFGGFRDIVDAVGGVELCLDEAIVDQDAGIDLPAGCQVLDGRDALGYVRVRKIDNDLERIRRQQQFVRALAAQTAQPATLLNPVRLLGVTSELGDAVTVDQEMGTLDLLRLAWNGRGLASGDLVTHTVPADPGRTAGGADVLHVRDAEAEALFARFRDGSVLDEATGGRTRAALAPEDIDVTVLNGAGVVGLAGRAGEALTAEGFVVLEVGNANARHDTTTIRHPPGERAAAEVLAASLPISPGLEETDAVDRVTLLLGRDAGALG